MRAIATAGAAPGVRDGADDPLSALVSTDLGVPQLQWAWVVADDFDPELLRDPRYARHVVGRMPASDEIAGAFASLGEIHERALTGSLNEFLDVAITISERRYLLDAALANPDPRSRREIALLLLQDPVDASIQLSHLTPINVLCENPTLDAEDLPVLRRLLAAGARPGPGLGGPAVARDPLDQVRARPDADRLVPLIDALSAARADDPRP